jgi:uncharacterized membrane protein
MLIHSPKRMIAQPRRDWDLWSIGILSLILIFVVYALPDSPLRIVIGLPFILFFPGYAALSVLFPESKDLEIIERVALSFGLSIAISPLVGFGLNYTPFGIRLAPILFSLAALNVALSAGGLYRRERAEAPYLPFDPEAVWKKYTVQFRAEKGVDKVLTIVLVISILSSVIALVYVVAVPRQGESFTEFYILGPGGNATGYPRNLTVGQDASVIIGIANHEHRTVDYTVELWLVNMSFVENVKIASACHVLLRFLQRHAAAYRRRSGRGVATAVGAALRVQRDDRGQLQAVVPPVQGRRAGAPLRSLGYDGVHRNLRGVQDNRCGGERGPEPEPESSGLGMIT